MKDQVMDIQNSGHPLVGVPLLFLTGLAEYIRRFSDNATIQDWASVISITAGTLAIIHYLFIIVPKVYNLFKRK